MQKEALLKGPPPLPPTPSRGGEGAGDGAGAAERIPSRIENPDELMKPLTRGNFPLLLGLALVGHVVFFGLTSINFIQLCFKYKSLHPMVQVRKELREAEEMRLQEARSKALEKFMPKQAPTPAPQPSQKEPAKEEPKADTKRETTERKKSKIERTTEEKSMERPKEATNPLEDVRGIE